MNGTKNRAVAETAIVSVGQTVRSFVSSLGKIPGRSILLGISKKDGLPVLMNSGDKNAPNIVIWNKLAKQGLKILKVIAEYLFRFHSIIGYKPAEIEFVVLTDHAEDWGELNNYGLGSKDRTPCIGIIPFHSTLSDILMRGLARWTSESHTMSRSPVIVLIDGMETLMNMSEDFKLDFRFLLLRGRNRHIYIIGTAYKKNFHRIHQWLDGFQREIYGSDFPDTFEYVEGQESLFFYTPITEMI